MKRDGIYRSKKNDLWDQWDIKINLKETEKRFVLTLIEDNSRYTPSRFEMMFRKSKKISVPKECGVHHFNWGEDYFVIYPYRDGIPYLFEKCNDSQKGSDKVDV